MNASPRPRWKTILEWTAAVALAALWLSAGLWKLSDLTGMQVRLTQALVPRELSLAAALGLGTIETMAAILLLAPAWRRWGAWLSAGLLAVFMAYIGYHYRALTGLECSCFPWLKRAIGPMFFVQDAAMIVVAMAAGWWARPSRDFRRATMALAGVLLLGGGMLAWERTRGGDEPAPASIVAEGRELPLNDGRVFLYFFNPLCPHCFDAAKAMARMNWQATVVGLPTQDFELGRGFFQDAGLRGVRLSPDGLKLRESTFPFVDVPYAVAIEAGRVREKLVFFDEPDLGNTLRRLGFVL